MDIRIEYMNDVSKLSDQIKKMLERYDEEFVPPLSSRDKNKPLTDWSRNPDGIMKFYRSIINNEFIIAFNNDKIIGFLSFERRYRLEHVNGLVPCAYASPVIVEKDYRRMGIATKMYERLIHKSFSEFGLKYIVTRTWSMNHAHINLLRKLGFKTATILKDHRGSGIDTIYFYLENKR